MPVTYASPYTITAVLSTYISYVHSKKSLLFWKQDSSHYVKGGFSPKGIGISVQYPDTEDNRFDNNQVIDSKLQKGDTNRNQTRNMLP